MSVERSPQRVPTHLPVLQLPQELTRTTDATGDGGSSLWGTLAHERSTGTSGSRAARSGAPGPSRLSPFPETVAETMVAHYDLGASRLLIRGYDPLPDAVDYGRELIPRVRALVAERDTTIGRSTLLDILAPARSDDLYDVELEDTVTGHGETHEFNRQHDHHHRQGCPARQVPRRARQTPAH